jgi:hypothetical protein
VPTQQFNETLALTEYGTLHDTDGTSQVQIGSAELRPKRYDQILVSSSDPVARVIDLGVMLAGTFYFLGSATIPANAGRGGAKTVDILADAVPTSLAGLPMAINTVLNVQAEVALSAATEMQFVLVGGYL